MGTNMVLWKTKYKNKGTALMATIIIIAIIIVFSLALLLVSYNLYASQNKNAASLRCSEAANTLSVELEKELTDPEAYKYSDLWKYLRCNIMQDTTTWPYYDPDESAGHDKKAAYRYFDLKYNRNYDDVNTTDNTVNKTLKGFPGSVKLCVYWTVPDAAKADLHNNVAFYDISPTNKCDTKLYVEIICEAGNQSYSVTNVYKIDVAGLDGTNASEKKLIDATAKLKTTKYDSTKSDSEAQYLYNPLRLEDSIKEDEGWTITFETRE